MLSRKSGIGRALALTAVVSGAACTTATYSGPRRSADEVAVLITSGDQMNVDDGGDSGVSTKVAKIDGKDVKSNRFELLPGRHSVEVTGLKTGDVRTEWSNMVLGPGTLSQPQEPRRSRTVEAARGLLRREATAHL
jgi:hypothetical protein